MTRTRRIAFLGLDPVANATRGASLLGTLRARGSLHLGTAPSTHAHQQRKQCTANAEALALLATAAAVATADGASILGASLFGSLCVAAIRPTYGDASDVYATVGVIVCAVGALSGGAVAALAPQKVTAVSAAGLVALPLALLLEKHGKCPDSGIAPDASGSVLGALLITILCGVALYLAERDPRRDAQVKSVAHALGAGWIRGSGTRCLPWRTARRCGSTPSPLHETQETSRPTVEIYLQ